MRVPGLNHPQSHMRKSDWPEYKPITRLKCVGREVRRRDESRRNHGRIRSFDTWDLRRIHQRTGVEPPGHRELPALGPIEPRSQKHMRLPDQMPLASRMKNVDSLYSSAVSPQRSGEPASHVAINAGAIVTFTSRGREHFPSIQAIGVPAEAVLKLVVGFVLIESMTIVSREIVCARPDGWVARYPLWTSIQ